MARVVALVVVGASALAFAPHPTAVLPGEPPVEEVTTGQPSIPERVLEMRVPAWPFQGGCLPEYDRFWLRLQAIATEDAVTADNLGPPDPPGPPFLDSNPHRAVEPPTAFPHRRVWVSRPRAWAADSSPQAERSLALGLFWIARQQRADGGWEFEAGDKNDRAAATGLALLTFLAVHQTYKAPAGAREPRYWRNVEFGLTFLTQMCRLNGPNAGRFECATTMIGQALATLALVEAYGLTRDTILKPFAQAALNYIQKKQAPDGGWADTADGASDLVVVGWQLQVIFAARVIGELVVSGRVIPNAMRFLDCVSAGPRRATYGATDNLGAPPGTTLTAIGLWCRYHLDGWGPNHLGLVEGVQGLMKNPPGEKNRDPLYLYYATWVVSRSRPADWKTWNAGPEQPDGTRKGGFRDVLYAAQIKKDDAAMIGSWDPEGEFGERYGRLGTTALNVLTLEVYYRYLPLYKRETGGSIKNLEDIK
jgi:hypothetical protein